MSQWKMSFQEQPFKKTSFKKSTFCNNVGFLKNVYTIFKFNIN